VLLICVEQTSVSYCIRWLYEWRQYWRIHNCLVSAQGIKKHSTYNWIPVQICLQLDIQVACLAFSLAW
jgi:hypothetical protein